MFNTAGLIFQCRHKYLIILCDSNSEKWKDSSTSKWNFPKGKFDSSLDSSYIETAIREAKIKTDLAVKEEWLSHSFKSGKSIFYFVDSTKVPHDFYKNLKTNDDSLDIFYRWASLEDIKKIPGEDISSALKNFVGRKD